MQIGLTAFALEQGVRLNYTPNAGFTGTETITYLITDPFGATSLGTIIFTVSPIVA